MSTEHESLATVQNRLLTIFGLQEAVQSIIDKRVWFLKEKNDLLNL